MKSLINISIFLYTILTLTGCATLMNHDGDMINVNTQPSGASILMNNQVIGKTPISLELPAKNIYYLEFQKSGFENKTYILSGNVGGGWIIADVLFGLVPVVIDAADGKWYGYPDKFIDVELEPLNKSISDSVIENSYEDLPNTFSIKLSSNQLTKLLGKNATLTYQSSKWNNSFLFADGILGMSEYPSIDSRSKSIKIERHEIFYMNITSSIKYKVEVVQEVWGTLSLDFTKI